MKNKKYIVSQLLDDGKQRMREFNILDDALAYARGLFDGQLAHGRSLEGIEITIEEREEE